MRNETKRQAVLAALEMLDTAPEPEFDTITRGAQQMFGAESAFISFVDHDRLWFKSRCNLDSGDVARDITFCDHAVVADELLIVPDTHADPRFACNPFVVGAPFIRFYAGVPLHARALAGGERVAIGALCVIDPNPQQPHPAKIRMLQDMAEVVEALLELRRVGRESLAMALERHDTLVASDRIRTQLLQAERMANIGSWRLDLLTEQVTWSDQTYVIHALEPAHGTELSNALTYYPPADRARIAAAIADCAEHGRSWDLELDFVDAAGQARRVRAIGEPELAGGKPVALIGVIQDITDRYRLEQSLREMALTDELTGLASRRAFNELLDAGLIEARATGTPLAVALVDLDHFKDVNDLHGHSAGDEVLRRAAVALRHVDGRDTHVVARLGGDEFVVMMRGDAAGADLTATVGRLLGALRLTVVEAGETISVSATIGASRLTPDTACRYTLLKAADHALYRAKQARRGAGAVDGRIGLVAAVDPLASAA